MYVHMFIQYVCTRMHIYICTLNGTYLIMPNITAGEESDESADDGGRARVQWVSRHV